MTSPFTVEDAFEVVKELSDEDQLDFLKILGGRLAEHEAFPNAIKAVESLDVEDQAALAAALRGRLAARAMLD